MPEQEKAWAAPILDGPDEERFHELVRKHDLTYEYSDSHSVYKRGHAEWAAIQTAAQSLKPGRAEAIWNYWVVKKLGNRDESIFNQWRWNNTVT